MTARRERRRAAVDQREQRRDTIRNLLARVDRAAAGRLTLTPAEAAHLRAQVEAEIAHGEDMRRTAAGAQAQTRSLRQQLTAAEDAIREAEAERDRYEDMTRTGAALLAQAEEQHAEQRTATVAALDASQATLRRYRERAEQAEAHLADLAALRDEMHAAATGSTLGRPLLGYVADMRGVRAAVEAQQHRADQLNDIAREHRQRADRAEAVLARIRNAHRWGDVWAALGMFYSLTPEQAGVEARNRRTANEIAADQRAEAASRVGAEHLARAERLDAAWRSARRRALATEQRTKTVPVTLATPCTNPECEHPCNWHTSTHGCVSRGGACPCRGFEPPTVRQVDAGPVAVEEAAQ
ncbi:hypothetical protein PV318_03205 [Streptomyces sp. ME02-6991-2B]|nr:hypothetical protein [Streptomyces sp. ME02-6991-2B]